MTFFCKSSCENSFGAGDAVSPHPPPPAPPPAAGPPSQPLPYNVEDAPMNNLDAERLGILLDGAVALGTERTAERDALLDALTEMINMHRCACSGCEQAVELIERLTGKQAP
jgi:hypothetical protein